MYCIASSFIVELFEPSNLRILRKVYKNASKTSKFEKECFGMFDSFCGPLGHFELNHENPKISTNTHRLKLSLYQLNSMSEFDYD